MIAGVCQTDYSGYPDCRDSTIKSLQATLKLGVEYDIIVHTPLMLKTKAKTIKLMEKLFVVWNPQQSIKIDFDLGLNNLDYGILPP